MPNQDAHQPLRGASEIPDWWCPNPLGTLGLIRPDSDRLTANQSFRCAPRANHSSALAGDSR